jgi:hypothetical protein
MWLCAGTVIVMLLGLYMLDFFCPPHLPGQYFVFSPVALGRFLVGLAVVASLATCYLSAKYYPNLPLLVTISMCPACITLLRQATLPREQPPQDAELPRGEPNPAVAPVGTTHTNPAADFIARLSMLKKVTGEERDQKIFYRAMAVALVFSCLVCVVYWVPWAIEDEPSFRTEMDEAESQEAKEVLLIRWLAPIIVAFSNLVFASFAMIRVALNRAYTGTDAAKNHLIAGMRTHTTKELTEQRIAALQARLARCVTPTEALGPTKSEVIRTTKDKRQEYLVQHVAHMKQLSRIVKLMGCTLVALVGVAFLTNELVAADSHIAGMIFMTSVVFFLMFVVFIYVSFKRLFQVLSGRIWDMPLWKSVLATCSKDWARALALWIALPAAPLFGVLSVANQAVRRHRGLSTQKRWLTERAQRVFDVAFSWDWVRVVSWMYVWGTVFLVVKLVPIFLNILLSWMSSVLDSLTAGMDPFAAFGLLLAATFAAGMVLFMLPPVPGPPIYLFGGYVISKRCPWGFAWGCVICVVLSFVLKLVACTVQQKLIGEWLGSREAVRQCVGVHRPFIRAIEAVLRRPGLSFGKCMILCGGPDWPTSVLAGMLRLSLAQCLLGTCPVIASVVPLALTGSFYLRREDSEAWIRMGNLMLTLTALVSVFFWAGMGWVIQDEFERHSESLARPKEEYLELDWLDHRAAAIESRCKVTWRELPRALQIAYLGGAVTLTAVGHSSIWASSRCFGTFKVTDDIDNLHWFGTGDSLLHPLGVAGLSLACASYLGLIAYQCWKRRHVRGRVCEIAREVDALEPAWKAQRLTEARRACAVCRETSKPDLEAGTDSTSTVTEVAPDHTTKDGCAGPAWCLEAMATGELISL